jgi:OOP family OmpA-OmpF porin
VKAGLLKQKVDNFYVVMDASGSQDETYRGYTKFAIAHDFLSRCNQTIPDVPLNAGLRGFGHSRRPFAQKTKLYYGPTEYTKAGFKSGVDDINWGGAGSPADLALDSAAADMTPWSGRTALIFVGDGQYDGYDPVGAAKRLKAQYGDNLCIYTVLVGSEDPASIKYMNDIAEAGECGFYQSAKYLESPQAMAAWVEAVLFEKAQPMAAAPTPTDMDGDGIPDNYDQCTNTPRGAPVNNVGCWIIPNVEFNFDKTDIKAGFVADLDEVTGVMIANPDVKMDIFGYTDSIGTEEYNLGLSERRANAVKNYLVDKGIATDRIRTQGLGETMPVATNETEWGRERNRRVELKWLR